MLYYHIKAHCTELNRPPDPWSSCDPHYADQALVCFSMVQPTGIEPVSTVLQTAAMTTSARVAWGEGRDSNSQPTESQSAALPLRYQHH